MTTNEYLQFGCGLCAPQNWRNFDVSPSLRIQKIPLISKLALQTGYFPKWPKNVEYGDIVKGLPIQSNSYKAIYCSHVLEHLALEDFRRALKNVYDYLIDGGVFRFVLPDLEKLIYDYTVSDKTTAAFQFMSNSYLGVEKRPRGITGFIRTILGNSRHLWMWDYAAINQELSRTGFTSVRRAYYGDNEDKQFIEVENEGRWKDALGIECRKQAQPQSSASLTK